MSRRRTILRFLAAVAGCIALAAVPAYWLVRDERQLREGRVRQKHEHDEWMKGLTDAHDREARSLRKMRLENKSIGGGQLSPDEATELRMLREAEARERIDALGKD